MEKTKGIGRRLLCTAGMAVGLGALPLMASAQGYPQETITLIAPTGPGSLVDILARLVADGMSEEWGQQVIVKNAAGAGGAIGVGQLAKADADGYTLGFVPANLTTLPYLYDISYDVAEDFVPVVQIAGASMVHYVTNEMDITTEADFIEFARAHPGDVTYAHRW